MPSATTSNYLQQKYLDKLLKGIDFTSPANIHIALFTTIPTLAASGGVEVSTSGTAYARVAVVQNTGWTGPSGTNIEYVNAADIQWATPTGNWGTIVGAGMYDASVGGNLLYVSTFPTPKVVNNGDGAPKILAGQLRILRATC